MKIALFCCLLCFSLYCKGQVNYPTDVFRSPLDIPLVLAGTFGELRSDHFHSGIDIETQEREGLPIYAIGDGTIARIKISLWGYGKALYIAHPNGYTSVYGHLQKFSPEIEVYIKKIQYDKKSYELDVFLNYGEIKIKKGEIIAYGGNTGGSFSPHLHFEIRNSISEQPTNPLLYGFNVSDAVSPTLSGLYGYPLSENAVINQSENKVQLSFSQQKDGSLLADKIYAIGTIGIGINVYDQQDLATNKNGVYSVQLLVNGKIYYDYNFESFSFSESRYINTFIDYAYFSKYKRRIQLCFRAPENRLSIYNILHNDGKILVKDGLSYTVVILIKDLKGNITKVIIPVEGAYQKVKSHKKENKTDTYIKAKKPNNFDLGIAKVYFPANTFYTDFYIDLKKGKDTVGIHHNKVPVHKKFTITFDVSKYTKEDQKQLFIARLDNKIKPTYVPAYKRINTFTTRTKNLGIYTLVRDTVAPKISAKNFKDKKRLDNYQYLSVNLSDDLSGIRSYTATINGNWILMEYEPKKKTLTYNFDDKIINDKQYKLKIIVVDNVGNSNTLVRTFYRK